MKSSVTKIGSSGTSSATERVTYPLGTAEFAAHNRVKADSVRHRFCITGSYFGVKPKKLMNGRLAWPDVQVEEQVAA